MLLGCVQDKQDKADLLKICNDLGLTVNIALLEKLLPIHRLPMEIQEGILSNDIPLSIVEMLNDLDEATGTAFASMFKALKISLNKQREIITLSREIAFREERSVLSVLQDDAVQSALNTVDIDRTRKAELIRGYLRRQRFPHLTDAENTFTVAVKALRLDHTAKLTPPANFEGANYTLTLSFQNRHELENHKQNIDKILMNMKWEAPTPFGSL